MPRPIRNSQFTIHNSQLLPRLYIALALLFLYAPILVMMLMAFNRSQLNELPFHFDLVWFERLAQNRRLISATLNSIILAVLTALTATALGTMAALALARYTFRGRQWLQALLIPPITIPWLILAVAMLIMFFWLGVPRSLLTLYLGHVTIQLPYTILVVSARLALPGILAAALFAFVISFDNFVISYFLAPPGVSTLPVEIYSAIRTGFTPEVNAISTLVFLVSAASVLLVGREIPLR
ncbi:MAG: peptide ABC transporter permease [Chloroflexi bacterium]|nr:MAG: peptide ABC transporter permease [Chloroflexota bacterium]